MDQVHVQSLVEAWRNKVRKGIRLRCRRGRQSESQPREDPVNMGIDSECVSVKGVCQNSLGRPPVHAWDAKEEGLGVMAIDI